jgi:hypothetical protein
MFLGRPHFSSSTLFPFDPPAFTVPSHIPHPSPVIPTTDDPTGHQSSKHKVLDTGSVLPNYNSKLSDKGKKQKKKKNDEITHQKQSIYTPYTPQTYQLPSSDWVWLTPWLINMRQDGLTDERGWEYNYFFRSGSGSGKKEKKFKKKGIGGWSCEVGISGWGGWVRRRMWVRLRMLVVQSEEEEEEVDDEKGEEDEEEGLDNPPSDRFSSTDGEDELELPDGEKVDVRFIVKSMANRSLDRERLDMWKNWLGDSSEKGKGKKTVKRKKEDSVARIKEVLGHEDNVRNQQQEIF